MTGGIRAKKPQQKKTGTPKKSPRGADGRWPCVGERAKTGERALHTWAQVKEKKHENRKKRIEETSTTPGSLSPDRENGMTTRGKACFFGQSQVGPIKGRRGKRRGQTRKREKKMTNPRVNRSHTQKKKNTNTQWGRRRGLSWCALNPQQ